MTYLFAKNLKTPIKYNKFFKFTQTVFIGFFDFTVKDVNDKMKP